MLSVHLLLCFLPFVLSVVNIDDYFTVKPGPQRDGGCDDRYPSGLTGKEMIQRWFQEAEYITDAAQTAMTNYAQNSRARENLLLFMGIKPNSNNAAPESAPKFNEVARNFQAMKDFLSNVPNVGSKKPWLFCGSGFWVEQDPRDPVELVFAQNQNPQLPLNPRPTIKDHFNRALQINDGYWKRLGSGPYGAYWSADMQTYAIQRPNELVNYCRNQFRRFGGTWDRRSPSPSITICMNRIWGQADSGDAGGVDTLGATEPQAGTSAMAYTSKGLTLYHELWHYLLGHADTPDSISNLKGVIKEAAADVKSANNAKSTSAWLPESLGVFAEAQWLTARDWPGSSPANTWGWDGDGNAFK